MPRRTKAETVARLKDKIGKASALYLLDFTKLGANDFNALRRRLGETKAGVSVVKNRLARRALTECGAASEMAQVLTGPTSMVFAGEDPVGPARTLRELMKRMAALKVKGTYLDQVFYPADRFDFIASLPTKRELQAEVVGVLQGPVLGLTFGLEGLLRELLYVLEQVGESARAPLNSEAPSADGGVA